MESKSIIILFVIIYVISIILSYWYIKIAHSKDGRWRSINTDITDFIMMILPIFNSIYTIITWIFYSPYNREINFDKFFNVKK